MTEETLIKAGNGLHPCPICSGRVMAMHCRPCAPVSLSEALSLAIVRAIQEQNPEAWRDHMGEDEDDADGSPDAKLGDRMAGADRSKYRIHSQHQAIDARKIAEHLIGIGVTQDGLK